MSTSDSYSGNFKVLESNEHTPETPEKPCDASTENNEGVCHCVV